MHEKTLQYFSPHSLQMIGEGSYGVAYLKNGATPTIIKRLKAKRIKPHYLHKFQQEIEFLHVLQHLPVPTVISTGFIDGVPYYEMSQAQGYTFEQAIFDEQACYTLQDVFFYTEQLLQIIISMHAAQIVHRDLRIPNILVHEQQLTIIDFGLASKIDTAINVTNIKNPKKIKHPISDLYEIGHFMLFLLYSTYEVTSKRSKSWQQELQLPPMLQAYIERLLMIQQPFVYAEQALDALISIKKAVC